MTTSTETDRVRTIMDKGAGHYDREMGFFDKVLFGGVREWACSQIAGEVLEIAVGAGRNLPFYPSGVTATGVELSGEMLAIARERAKALGLDTDLQEGDAE